ncbi:hypothetical protein J7L84_03490 [Candidatus Bipolaricaulota bacterium]|nr:hypothetical protein [Candidatus Bipolaricaulota bacterium]
MRRALLLVALATVILGSVALANGSCCTTCATNVPCCYTAYWVGEEVHFKLVIPFSLFCCCCCDGSKTLITGWHVEDMQGNVIYQETLPQPQDPCCYEMVWKQVDSQGNQVAAGFYKIVVETTTGNYSNYVKIVEKNCCCCFFGLWSRPCGASLCHPYVKLFHCPSCCVSCWPCCCGITIYIGPSDP